MTRKSFAKSVCICCGLLFLSFLFVVSEANSAFALERILEMNVSAVVHPESSLTVTEEISFIAEGQNIRRGLIRVFPVKYNVNGRTREVRFAMKSATLDGRSVEFRTERSGADVEIRLGNPREYLPVGRHTYVLTYTATREIRFFDDHDELYWNVTGNDWDFSIEKASFRVTLPNGAHFTNYDGYTGGWGARGKDFRLDQQRVFSTTRALRPREGFTVAVGWPKGIVTPPPLSFMEKYWPYIAGLSVLSMFGWYVFAWLRWGRDPRRGIVLPLFAPPDNMEPGAVRYVRDLKYDEQSLGADILYLAVEGQLVIREDERDGLELIDVPAAPERMERLKAMPERLQVLRNTLFADPERKIRISGSDKKSSEILYSLLQNMKEWFISEPYYSRNFFQWLAGIPFFLPAVYAVAVSGETAPSFGVLAGGGAIVLAGMIFFLLIMPSRTPLGRSLLDKIEGFVLYLKTAETHRLEVLYPDMKGHLPEQTPVLFEKFLPWALALDTADTWANGFASVLGRNYAPEWYATTSADPLFGLQQMAQRGLVRGLYGATAAGVPAPKSSPRSWSGGSGLGGGGFSGGGGGGGGGRGW